MSALSDRLLKAITDAGYSYGELAKLTGIPKSAIQRYATGGTEKPPSDRLALLARHTGVSAAYLMGWEGSDDGNGGAANAKTSPAPFGGLDPVADRAFFKFMSDVKREGIGEKDLKLILDFIKRAKTADNQYGK